jgi:hypothetical protein
MSRTPLNALDLYDAATLVRRVSEWTKDGRHFAPSSPAERNELACALEEAADANQPIPPRRNATGHGAQYVERYIETIEHNTIDGPPLYVGTPPALAPAGWYYAIGTPFGLLDHDPVGPFSHEGEALDAGRAFVKSTRGYVAALRVVRELLRQQADEAEHDSEVKKFEFIAAELHDLEEWITDDVEVVEAAMYPVDDPEGAE